MLHSLLALASIKRLAMGCMKQSYKYYRLLYSILATAILAWVVHCHFSISEAIIWRPPLIEKMIAAILVISGFAIMLIFLK